VIFKETESDIVSTELSIKQIGRLYLIEGRFQCTTLSKHVSVCGSGPIVPACEDAMRVKRRWLFDHVGVFMADIIFALLSLL
jgi:hypothetical protein